MAPNPRRVLERIDALYVGLPKIQCKGLCSSACGVIHATNAEEQRLERVGGRPLGVHADGSCTFLDPMGRCEVYGVRPLICRLWGVTEGMPCSHGCLDETEELLSDDEAWDLLARAQEIAGQGASARAIRDALRDPKTRSDFLTIARRGQEVSFPCDGCGRRMDAQVGINARCPNCGLLVIVRL